MNKKHRLRELKIRASLLLKDVHAPEPERHLPAARRFLHLPFMRHSNAEAVLGDLPFFRLKHAYAVLAIEAGFNNWNALREAIIREDCLYSDQCACFLNAWFADYRTAQNYLQQHGGYLLKFRKDFVVCQQEYITQLGLGHYPAEWKAIAYNWVEPACKASWQKLYTAARNNYLSLL